jgi:hypothetical protein
MRGLEDYQRDCEAFRAFLREVARQDCDEHYTTCITPAHPGMAIANGCFPCKARRILGWDHPGDYLNDGVVNYLP